MKKMFKVSALEFGTLAPLLVLVYHTPPRLKRQPNLTTNYFESKALLYIVEALNQVFEHVDSFIMPGKVMRH